MTLMNLWAVVIMPVLEWLQLTLLESFIKLNNFRYHLPDQPPEMSVAPFSDLPVPIYFSRLYGARPRPALSMHWKDINSVFLDN